MQACRLGRLALALPLIWLLCSSTSEAGGRRARRAQAVVATSTVAPTTSSSSVYAGRLGTFNPTPMMYVRGNGVAGGGYSPLGSFGDSTMVLYGPLAAQRDLTAPVVTYVRGYDGRVLPVDSNSFSTPNQPGLTPVVYPTQSTYYYGFRESGTPPWWKSGMNWIDQN